jgi:hypothetical protein
MKNYADYIGIPYQERGRTREGCDCWGLVRLVFAEQYGIELPSYDYDGDPRRQAALIAEHAKDGTWQEQTEPVAGDVLVLRQLRVAGHVAVCDGDGFLHCEEGIGVVRQSLDDRRWRQRIVGIFRHKALAAVQIVTCPSPLSDRREFAVAPAGVTLLDVVLANVDPRWHEYTYIDVCGTPVPPEAWAHTRLREGALVTLRVVPKGGGGNWLRMILTVAVMAWAGGAGGAMFGKLFGGSQLAMAAGKVVASMVGMLAVNAIVKPPRPTMPQFAEQSTVYSISGARNTINPYGAVPVILGSHRFRPPYAARPYTLIEGNDQYLCCLFTVGYGPLAVTDIKIGDNDLSSFSGVYYEYREGTAVDSPITVFPRTVIEEDLAIALTNSAGYQYRNTAADTDEATIDITFAQGLARMVNGEPRMWSVYFDIRYRIAGSGSGWTNAVGSFIGGTWDGTNEVNRDHLFTSSWQSSTWDTGLCTDGFRGGDTRYPYAKVSGGGSNVVEHLKAYYWRKSTIGNTHYVAGPAMTLRGNGYTSAPTVTVQAAPGVTLTWKPNTLITGRVFSAAELAMKRYSVNIKFPSRNQWEIRVGRMTADTTDPLIVDKSHWATLRSIKNEAPLSAPYNVAKLALKIKASGQLNGIVDQLSCIVASRCPKWNAGLATWQNDQQTTNPADLYRYVLQHPANGKAVTDARIDLPAFQAWSEFCDAKGLKFEAVYDSVSTVVAVLDQIAAAGRATRAMNDDKYSIIIDEPRTTPVQMFTPRNIKSLTGSRSYIDLPHALRCRFPNRDNDWQQEERTVYRDGFDAATATTFEGVEMFGVTDKDAVWKLARYHIAVGTLQQETFTLETDIDHLVCTRGDKVLVQHDVPLLGIVSGRIKEVDDPEITIDEPILMEVGKTYGIQVMKADGTIEARDLAEPIIVTVRDPMDDATTWARAGGDVVVISDALGGGITWTKAGTGTWGNIVKSKPAFTVDNDAEIRFGVNVVDAAALAKLTSVSLILGKTGSLLYYRKTVAGLAVGVNNLSFTAGSPTSVTGTPSDPIDITAIYFEIIAKNAAHTFAADDIVFTELSDHLFDVTPQYTVERDGGAAWSCAAGDLYAIGETGLVTMECIVMDIDHKADLSATLTLNPYSADIYTADSGAIPAYTAQATIPVELREPDPPRDLAGTEFLYLRDGAYFQGVVLSWVFPEDTLADYYEVQILRPPSEDGWELVANSTLPRATADNVPAGYYTFRVRTVRGLHTSEWAEHSMTIEDLTYAAPDAPTGAHLVYQGPDPHLIWSPVTDIRPIKYEIRRIPPTTTPAWEAGTFMAVTDTTGYAVPLAGTYLIAALAYGVYSLPALVYVPFKTLDVTNIIEQVSEHDDWDGTWEGDLLPGLPARGNWDAAWYPVLSTFDGAYDDEYDASVLPEADGWTKVGTGAAAVADNVLTLSDTDECYWYKASGAAGNVFTTVSFSLRVPEGDSAAMAIYSTGTSSRIDLAFDADSLFVGDKEIRRNFAGEFRYVEVEFRYGARVYVDHELVAVVEGAPFSGATSLVHFGRGGESEVGGQQWGNVAFAVDTVDPASAQTLPTGWVTFGTPSATGPSTVNRSEHTTLTTIIATGDNGFERTPVLGADDIVAVQVPIFDLSQAATVAFLMQLTNSASGAGIRIEYGNGAVTAYNPGVWPYVELATAEVDTVGRRLMTLMLYEDQYRLLIDDTLILSGDAGTDGVLGDRLRFGLALTTAGGAVQIGAANLFIADTYRAGLLLLPGGTATYTTDAANIVDLGYEASSIVDTQLWATTGVACDLFDIADLYDEEDLAVTGLGLVGQFVIPEIQTSPDAVDFDEWAPIIPGNYYGRAFNARLALTAPSKDRLRLYGWQWEVDMPDRQTQASGTTTTTGEVAITWPIQFQAVPEVLGTIQTEQAGDHLAISSITETGCDISVYNAGNRVIRTVVLLATGY